MDKKQTNTRIIKNDAEKVAPHGNNYLHNIVLERMLGRTLKPNEYCVHIDGDGLNNQRSNLRVVTMPPDFVYTDAERSSSGYAYQEKTHYTGNEFYKALIDGEEILGLEFRCTHKGSCFCS